MPSWHRYLTSRTLRIYALAISIVLTISLFIFLDFLLVFFSVDFLAESLVMPQAP